MATARKILIIEDEAITALAIQNYMPPGSIVKTVQNYSETLAHIEENPDVDLLIMDINLGPDSASGLDIMDELQRRNVLENVPVIAITAYANYGDRDKLIELGFAEFVPKPVNKKYLLSIVKQLLHHRPG